MAEGTKSSEFEKGKIKTLKRMEKSQREISKAFWCSKIVICNYLKSPNGGSAKYQNKKIAFIFYKCVPWSLCQNNFFKLSINSIFI